MVDVEDIQTSVKSGKILKFSVNTRAHEKRVTAMQPLGLGFVGFVHISRERLVKVLNKFLITRKKLSSAIKLVKKLFLQN